jgi:hypothetical protein
MDKKNCSHKQKRDIIDNLFEHKNEKIIIDIDKLANSTNNNSLSLPTNTPTLSKLTPLPPISTEKQELKEHKVEHPKVEHPKVEHPKVEHPKAEHPKVEPIKFEQPKQEKVEQKTEPIKNETKKNDDNMITSLMINSSRENFSNVTIEEIHLNFKTLSRIKEHDKMYLRDLKFLEIDDSYLQMVSRTVKNVMWAGYNREDVIDFLIHLTDQTIKTCDALSYSLKSSYDGKENTKNTLTNLLIDMEQALMGLQKLKITYYNDNAILTRLDMIIDKFDKKIREMKDYLLKN